MRSSCFRYRRRWGRPRVRPRCRFWLRYISRERFLTAKYLKRRVILRSPGDPGKRCMLAGVVAAARDLLFAFPTRTAPRLAAFSLLLAAYIVPMSAPAVDLFFRGGQLHRADTFTTAAYLAIFTLSLPMWCAQALYARAFYATGNTLTPMAASTGIVLVSLPIYAGLFRWLGAPGLAWASDIGITLQALVFAGLLHRRGLVPAIGLDRAELARSLAAAVVSGGVLYAVRAGLPQAMSRPGEAVLLFLTALIWLLLAMAVLLLTGSKLPGELTARLRKRRSRRP